MDQTTESFVGIDCDIVTMIYKKNVISIDNYKKRRYAFFPATVSITSRLGSIRTHSTEQRSH